MTNTYIVKMMSCNNNENEDKCVEQMQQSIYNEYENECDIYI